jgi:hypothetical protein
VLFKVSSGVKINGDREIKNGLPVILGRVVIIDKVENFLAGDLVLTDYTQRIFTD